MLSDDLILEYLNLRLEKVKAIKKQSYQFAAEFRDKERQKSKEIWRILNPDGEFVDWITCDKIIDDYCLQVYNCSTYDYALCVKSIERIKKLRQLGI
jgi:hypothetical protein